MADLDDFFKKKDSKKTKGKKFAVNDPLSVSASDSKNGKAKQEKTTSFNSTLLSNENDLFSSQQTDEWKEFQEEEKKDYSGLKIQNLQINENENGQQNSKQNESEEETEINEQGETVVKKKCGPWKMIQEQKKEEVEPPPPVVEEKKPPKEEEKPSDRYVPPSRRAQGFNTTNVKKPTPNNKPRDLSSQELFPTLGSTVPKPKPKTKALQ